jgi:mannose-6-phosphate isomerase-like protein (cupin superfamily)
MYAQGPNFDTRQYRAWYPDRTTESTNGRPTRYRRVVPTVPHVTEFAAPVSHDPDVYDREAQVAGVRWAIVEYSPGASRRDWCSTPHSGYIISGSLTYRFEDDSNPLSIGAGEAFAIPSTPRHRGENSGTEPARLFLIDALPGA